MSFKYQKKSAHWVCVLVLSFKVLFQWLEDENTEMQLTSEAWVKPHCSAGRSVVFCAAEGWYRREKSIGWSFNFCLACIPLLNMDYFFSFFLNKSVLKRALQPEGTLPKLPAGSSTARVKAEGWGLSLSLNQGQNCGEGECSRSDWRYSVLLYD